VPLAALRRVLSSVVAVLRSNHPGFFERMEGYCDVRFLIDPTDLPFAFLFHPDPDCPAIEPLWRASDDAWDVRVTGRLDDLVDLFEGNADGDALFFARAITIEGDTSAVLALRNAVDGEEIRLVSEMADQFGPFGMPLRVIGEHGPELVSRTHDLFARIRNQLLQPVVAPLRQSNEKMQQEIGRLTGEIAALRRKDAERARADK